MFEIQCGKKQQNDRVCMGHSRYGIIKKPGYLHKARASLCANLLSNLLSQVQTPQDVLHHCLSLKVYFGYPEFLLSSVGLHQKEWS